MDRRIALVVALTCSATLFAAPQSARSKTPSLAERFPAPPGYSVEQDVESEGTRDFSMAKGVRGHILRRFVQAGDDGPTAVPQIARFFADQLHAQNGILFDDGLNSSGGRLDGCIPGPRPIWLHVDINDSGALLDVMVLEESASSPRDRPLEEASVAGSLATGTMFSDAFPMGAPPPDPAPALRMRDTLASLVRPAFSPLQGWAWLILAEDVPLAEADAASLARPFRVSVTGRERSQACATCAVTADTRAVTAFNVDVNRIASLGELDSSTVPADGFFRDPGFTASGSVTKFKDGGRVLIQRAGRPPLFVPVTREAYLQARIRYVQAKGGAVDDLRKELGSLSDQEKASPATDALGRGVAMLNPAYFEAGRGRTAVHFAVIDVPWKYGVNEVTLYQSELVDAFLASAALAELVK